MRITNSMMTNNILLSINKNKEAMANYEEQLATGKKIQKPSDDPIVAARALKFRTNISEISQYKTNAQDANSWLDVTEQAISNTTSVIQRISELAVEGSSGTLTTSNREAIIAEMAQLKEEIVSEANVSYAGRYIFAGYQTDKALSFTEDSDERFEITENLEADSLESVQRVVDGQILDVQRIRLAYDGITTPLSLDGFKLEIKDSKDADAYEPPSTVTPDLPTVHFLKDTGELIFNDVDVNSIPADSDQFKVIYEKKGFVKNDLRPDQYFTSTNLDTSDNFTKKEEAMKYQISYSQSLQVNVMGYDFITTDLVRDLDELIKATGDITYDESNNDELNQELLIDKFAAMIDKMAGHLENNSNLQSKIGGKGKRLELTLDRLTEDNLSFTDLLSENEDVDMAETLIKFSAQEVVYQAALSSSSKIIQPTLLDFLG